MFNEQMPSIVPTVENQETIENNQEESLKDRIMTKLKRLATMGVAVGGLLLSSYTSEAQTNNPEKKTQKQEGEFKSRIDRMQFLELEKLSHTVDSLTTVLLTEYKKEEVSKDSEVSLMQDISNKGDYIISWDSDRLNKYEATNEISDSKSESYLYYNSPKDVASSRKEEKYIQHTEASVIYDSKTFTPVYKNKSVTYKYSGDENFAELKKEVVADGYEDILSKKTDDYLEIVSAYKGLREKIESEISSVRERK